jgi:2,5-diamino-6-(ribosylamino)-4(3H)-pyrimidinone 5'-phosphate reductase
MYPEIIIHNSISLDSSLTGFMPEMQLHYKIAGSYNPDAHLIGSETIIKGIEMFGEEVPDESPADFTAPVRSPDLPWWIIVDSGGKLKGILHSCRRFELCRDVMVLVSEATPRDYIKHLEERNYNFIVSGKGKVDIQQALKQIMEKFGIVKILTDTGRVLGNLLLNMGLVSEISLLVHPIIIGEKSYQMFSDIIKNPKLKLLKSEILENDYVWMVYRIEKDIP